MIVFGTIDFDRVVITYSQLHNAVREGAAYGARNPSDTAGITDRVLDHGVPAGVAAGDISVDCGGSCTNIAVGQTRTLTVTADHTFDPITTGFHADFGLDSIPLEITASMRVMP